MTRNELSDPVERRIRELQEYGSDDDPDSSVQIQALPGSIINVSAAKSESEPPFIRRPKWVKIAIGIVSALVGVAAVVQAVLEALKSR